MLLWRSWHLRCDITHGKGEETIASSVSFLLNYDTILYDQDQLTDKKEGNTVPNPFVSTNVSCSSKYYRQELADSSLWRPPAAGDTKINVDAAFYPETNMAAVGVVARNHLGAITAAASSFIGRCHDVEEAEALAILEGLKLAIDQDLKPSALESDCAVAVLNVNCATVNKSRSWATYRNIAAAWDLMPDCKIVKIARKSNSVAHELASIAIRTGLSNVWSQPIPEAIQALTMHDSVRLPVSNICFSPLKKKKKA
jgi:ribonuclease HI